MESGHGARGSDPPLSPDVHGLSWSWVSKVGGGPSALSRAWAAPCAGGSDPLAPFVPVVVRRSLAPSRWGEGFGFQDKIRWDDPIDHAADGGSGASQTLYQNGFFQDRPSVNTDWVFKIPQAELDANPNLGPEDQNP